MTSTKRREVKISGAGSKIFDAVTLEANRTSSTFTCDGYNQLELFGSIALASGTSITAIDLYVDLQPKEDNTNWYTVVEENVSSPPTVTCEMENGRKYSLTWTNANTTHYFCLTVPIFGENCRARLVVTGTGAAAELCTMYGELSVQ